MNKKHFAVSIVFTKDFPDGHTRHELYLNVVHADNAHEAIGLCIEDAEKKLSGYSIFLKLVRQIESE